MYADVCGRMPETGATIADLTCYFKDVCGRMPDVCGRMSETGDTIADLTCYPKDLCGRMPDVCGRMPETGDTIADLTCYPKDFMPDPTSRMPDDIKQAKTFSSSVPTGKHEAFSYEWLRPYATSVCGLKLLISSRPRPSRPQCQQPSATRRCLSRADVC
jgi:hypothetical protein